jgi:predicted RNase H-like HicB family nuclease
MSYKYAVIYETAADGSVSAYVPDLPTILVSGRTQAEARKRAIEGIQVYIEEMTARGFSIPETHILFRYSGDSRLTFSINE